MIKYINTQVVFQEFPGETTLAINISGCPNHCPDCHSKWLWEDTGNPLTTEVLNVLLKPYKEPGMITCVGFMGGDQDCRTVKNLARWVKENYPHLKVGWYSGRNKWSDNLMEGFDYVKFGPYRKECGGLDSRTTNQVMYKYIKHVDRWLDITKYFQTKNEDFHKFVNDFEKIIQLIEWTQHDTSYAMPGIVPDGNGGVKKVEPEFTPVEVIFEVHKAALEKYFEEHC